LIADPAPVTAETRPSRRQLPQKPGRAVASYRV
jgi:hypothetical protein